MKILVPAKRVADINGRLRLLPDGSGVDLTSAKMVMNPFDEIALEQAIRLKEAGMVSEIVIATIGTRQAQDILRTGLAMGADRAILVEAEGRIEPLDIAKILKALVTREAAQLVIAGKQAIDDDSNQTGQMLAALLGWPQATFASELTLEDGSAKVVREVDDGLLTVRIGLPAVVTADLRLNQPRFASLPNIMKAKKKPLEEITLADLGVSPSRRIEVVAVSEPARRQAGQVVGSVEELYLKLTQEARVL